MPEITAAQLDADERLCNEATPGPWVYRPNEHDDWGTVRAPDNMFLCLAKEANYSVDETTEELYARCRREKIDPRAHNAKFITRSREALPAYIQRIRELEAEIAKLREGK